jgi:hypothetical protein
VRLRGVRVRTSTIVAPMRAAVGAARRRGRVLLDGDDLARVLHQRREVGGLAAGRGAQVEHAIARPGASARATAIAARDCGISSPAPTRARRRCRTGRRGQRLRQPRRRGREALGERCAVVRSVLARSAARPARCRPPSARGGLGAEGLPPQRGDPLGCECCSAACGGVASGSAATSGAASRARAAQHGVDQPGAARRVALGQLDRLADRGVRGTRSRKVS